MLTVEEPGRRSTGSAALDELLGGGLETGTVTMVYGPPGSGKTNVALAAAVAVAMEGDRVLYIDTEGISPERLSQIVSGKAVDLSTITDRIIVKEVHGFADQHDAVRDAEAVTDELGLIVLDSATGYYRLERTADDREGDALRELTRQVTQLLSLARKHALPVLLTNQVYTDPESDRVRALGGHTLNHWAGAVIRLERFRGGNRRATLEKHRSLAAGDSVGFKIVSSGLDRAERLD